MNILSHGHTAVLNSLVGTEAIESARQALSGFELGRFLLGNLGLNGYWTSYVLMHPERGRLLGMSSDGSPITELEAWLLNRCPIFLATQERFRIFRELTQPLLRSGLKLASLPSGVMDDLLTLDYSGMQEIEISAIDLDSKSLREAEANYKKLAPPVQVQCEQCDAWNLRSGERWDLITSNGLNIYVEEDERCTELYRSIAQALRPSGIFVLSFITPPSEWKPHNQDDLEYQRFLFTEVIPVKWSCVREESKTREQLRKAGFEVLAVQYDSQRMFPAVVARKCAT
jgi:hypothetical protein